MSTNTVQSLNANFKELYGELKNLVPNNTKFIKNIPFSKGDKQLGNALNEPIILGLEAGFTYGGQDGLAFNLNQAIAFPLKNARIKSSELVLRSAISAGMASRSQSQKGAFERGMKLLTGNMLKSMYHRLEISSIYGQANIGVVKTVVSSTVIELEAHSWAPGIWVGLAKTKIDILDPALSALSINTEVQSYDLITHRVTVASTTGVTAGDVIYFEGAVEAGVTPIHNDMKGLHSIIEERVSLFEVPNANEPLFQGNIVNVGTDATTNAAVFSFAKLEEGVARAVEKGLTEEEITVIVNVRQWSDLLTEQSGKRSIDSSYSTSKLQEGTRELEFYSQAGICKIIPSTFVKEGFAYAYCQKDLVRVGSTDVTFDPPGYEGEFFKLLENSHGYEIRCYSDQAIFTTRPGAMTMFRYIKVSA